MVNPTNPTISTADSRRPGALPGGPALLARLERAFTGKQAHYRIEDELPDAAARADALASARALLGSPSWEARNAGVKLLGLLQAPESAAAIVAVLRDRRRAAWYKRLLGGDFEQVGFIRRNALTALARLGETGPDVEDVIIRALDDPYYEARVEAARTLAILGPGFSEGARRLAVAGLTRRLRDRWLEVAAAAAESLGRIGREADAVPALVALGTHRYWMVRAAALNGLCTLVERGEVAEGNALERQVRGFVLAATDFRPEFTIKSAYARLLAAIGRQTGGPR